MDETEIRQRRAYEWVCGRNTNGELSLGVKKNAIVPAYVIGLRDVSAKQVCSSSNHSILLSSNGKCFFSGSKLHGKLGKNNDTGKQTIFKEVAIQLPVRMVACNDYTSLFLMQD
jgi:alpha-tubulin suppressor-like RCC1 family protein